MTSLNYLASTNCDYLVFGKPSKDMDKKTSRSKI